MIHTGREHDVALSVIEAVEHVNDRQKRALGRRVIGHFGGRLDGKKIAVWGLAFKPGTDDVREAPALTLIDQLREARAQVSAYDPAAAPNVRAIYGDHVELASDPYAAAAGADALVLVTEWPELRRPDLEALAGCMRARVLFDGRNVWSPEETRRAGFAYHGIGRR